MLFGLPYSKIENSYNGKAPIMHLYGHLQKSYNIKTLYLNLIIRSDINIT